MKGIGWLVGLVWLASVEAQPISERLPTCNDRNPSCPGRASPQFLESSFFDAQYNVWSDSGFCNLQIHSAITDFMKNTCTKSCGFCQSSCENELDKSPEAQNGEVLTCEEILLLEPNACKCDGEGDCLDLHHGDYQVMWVRNWCTKSCFERGDYPNAKPCYDVCRRDRHPCKIPYTYKGNTYTTCNEVKNGFLPTNYDKHNTPKGKGIKWCSTVDTYAQPSMDWAYCSCSKIVNAPTQNPTLSPEMGPSQSPTVSPSSLPSTSPTLKPTGTPVEGTPVPTKLPTFAPTSSPVPATPEPTHMPSRSPTMTPTFPDNVCSDIGANPGLKLLKSRLSNCPTNGNPCEVDLSPYREIRICDVNGLTINAGVNLIIKSDRNTILDARGIPTQPCFTLLKQNRGNIASLTLQGVTVRRCPRIADVQFKAKVQVVNTTLEDSENSDSGLFYLNGLSTEVRVEGSIIRNNKASQGGVIETAVDSAGLANIYFIGTVIENNFVENSGAVIYMTNDQEMRGGAIVFKDCIVRNNYAKIRGGVMSIEYGWTNIRLLAENTVFENNTADSDGGIIRFEGLDGLSLKDKGNNAPPLEERVNELYFKNCTIKDNKSNEAAVLNIFQTGNNRAIFDGGLITGNVADSGPVAVLTEDFEDPAVDFLKDPTTLVTFNGSVVISNNRAGGGGGVVHTDGYVRLAFDGATVSNNLAKRGGGVLDTASNGGLHLNITNSTFRDNVASLDGGVFAIISDAVVNIGPGSRFLRNTAQTGMGGVGFILPSANLFRVNRATTLSIMGPSTVFVENSAQRCGGALAVMGNTTNVTVYEGVEMRGNMGEDGGAICSKDGAITELYGASSPSSDGGRRSLLEADSNILFHGNQATGNGGSIFSGAGSTTVIEGVNFTLNQAHRYGGAVAVEYGSDMTITGSQFGNNSIGNPVEGGGGAIGVLSMTNASPNVRISKVLFLENYAMQGRDLYFQRPEHLSLTEDANMTSVKYEWEGLRGYMNCSECEFINSRPQFAGSPSGVSTVPSALRVFLSNSTSPKGVPTCDELGEELSESADPLAIASGDDIAVLCATLVDAFGRMITVPQDLTLSLRVMANTTDIANGRVHISNGQPVRTLALTDRVKIDRVQVFAEEGQYFLSVMPNPEHHLPGTFYTAEERKDDFIVRIPIDSSKCPVGQVRVEPLDGKTETSITRCSETNFLLPGGWYFPDPKNTSLRAICPPGTMRPQTMHALECKSCDPGYISIKNRTQCNYCSTLFQLSWDIQKEECDTCPEGAFCLGGNRVIPQEGYYHSTVFSYQFHKCLGRESCEYGTRAANLNRTRNMLDELPLDIFISLSNRRTIADDNRGGRQLQVTPEQAEVLKRIDAIDGEYRQYQCAEGYEGRLCGACASGYERSSLTECRKCSGYYKNAIFFAITFVLLLGFLIMTVNKTMRKRDTTSNAVKIVVAFIQQISVLRTFRVGWPDSVNGMIAFASGVSSTEITSIGCMFNEDNTGLPSFAVIAIVTIYVVPPALMILIPFVNFLLRRCTEFGKKFTVKVTKGNVIVMIIIIYFFLYPFIVIETVKLFACIPVDSLEDGVSLDLEVLHRAPGKYLLVNTRFECWVDGQLHKDIALGIGLPSLLLFVIGMPVALGIYLARNTKRFDDEDFNAKFGFIYVGMHHNRWFWFFLTVFRTSALAVIGMMVTDPGYQNLAAQFWLVFYLILTLYVNPYTMRTILNMEAVSTVTILSLLYLNMWIFHVNIYHPDEYNSVFGFLIIFLTLIGFLTLCVMGLYAYVAVSEKVNPSDLKFRDIVEHFKGKGKRGMSMVKKFTKNASTNSAKEKSSSKSSQNQTSFALDGSNEPVEAEGISLHGIIDDEEEATDIDNAGKKYDVVALDEEIQAKQGSSTSSTPSSDGNNDNNGKGISAADVVVI